MPVSTVENGSMPGLRPRPLALALLAALALTPTARGDVLFEVVDLGPGAGGVAVNDLGQVLLNEGGSAVLWENGARTTLFAGTASGLNNAGDVVGRSTSGRATLVRGGSVIDLGPGSAVAINDLGEVLINDGGAVELWVDGSRTPVPALDGLQIRAMNDARQVVGNTPDAWPFYFDGTSVETILTGEGYAADINAAGAFIYTLRFPEANEMYLRENGVDTPIAVLAPFDDATQALGLNDANQVVGVSDGRGFLWEGGVTRDLNALLAPSAAGVWGIGVARSINNLGEILVSGARLGQPGARTLLLRPVLTPVIVPEPSSLALGALGAGLAAAVMRRRGGQASSCSRSRARTL
jgi:hypothetical protein